jgi:hypothetical protein
MSLSLKSFTPKKSNITEDMTHSAWGWRLFSVLLSALLSASPSPSTSPKKSLWEVVTTAVEDDEAELEDELWFRIELTLTSLNIRCLGVLQTMGGILFENLKLRRAFKAGTRFEATFWKRTDILRLRWFIIITIFVDFRAVEMMQLRVSEIGDHDWNHRLIVTLGVRYFSWTNVLHDWNSRLMRCWHQHENNGKSFTVDHHQKRERNNSRNKTPLDTKQNETERDSCMNMTWRLFYFNRYF